MKKIFKKFIALLSEHLIGILILAISVIIGLLVFKDYGISWDETIMRELGYMDYDYITKGGEYKPNPHYGVVTELPLVLLELKLNITDYQKIYFMRHLFVHLLFLISAFGFYIILFNQTKRKSIAILGYILLLLSPHLYAHSFYNSKDIPLISYFIFTFLTLQFAIKYNFKWIFILLGIFCSMAISARIIGLLLFVSIIGLFLAKILLDKTKGQRIYILTNLGIFIISTILFTYISWPLLWSSPIQSFIEMIELNSHYSVSGSLILFNGNYINSFHLPWWYLPGWMGITIPIGILVLFIFGIVIYGINLIKDAIKSNLRIEQNGLIFVSLSCFFVTLIAEMIFKMPIFDGWRHMYFLYLFVLLFATLAINWTFNKFSVKIGRMFVLSAYLYSLSILYFMIISHPFQHLYFNEIVNKDQENIREKYEFDVWGTSYRSGLEFILNDSKKQIVNVAAAHTAAAFNTFILTKNERNRIRFVNSLDSADYFVSCYRGHPLEYPLRSKVYAPKVLNSTYIGVWRVQKEERKLNIPIEQQ
ncbi:MAG: phospholipid carrier-dependent glycosyltransferase [Bacteroidetes bacterium]|nr:phospholipid carrier-dependent glycosyltransferase [Bacteroidota bacterium]